MAQEGNRSNVGRTLVHPPICRQFQRWGNCRFGKKCRYIHTTGGSTQRGRETAAITVETAENEVKNVEPKRPVDFRYLKTRLCKGWKRDGRCPYGSRCQFAHGEGELRAVGCSNPAVSLSSAGISAPAENNETGSIAGISAPAENNETGSIAGISAPAEVASNETGSSHPFKRRFKWNDVHKIKGIYGDWIDEL